MSEAEGEAGDTGSPRQRGRKEEGEGNHKPCYQTGEETSHGPWAPWPLLPSGHRSESDIFKLMHLHQGLPRVRERTKSLKRVKQQSFLNVVQSECDKYFNLKYLSY